MPSRGPEGTGAWSSRPTWRPRSLVPPWPSSWPGTRTPRRSRGLRPPLRPSSSRPEAPVLFLGRGVAFPGRAGSRGRSCGGEPASRPEGGRTRGLADRGRRPAAPGRQVPAHVRAQGGRPYTPPDVGPTLRRPPPWRSRDGRSSSSGSGATASSPSATCSGASASPRGSTGSAHRRAVPARPRRRPPRLPPLLAARGRGGRAPAVAAAAPLRALRGPRLQPRPLLRPGARRPAADRLDRDRARPALPHAPRGGVPGRAADRAEGRGVHGRPRRARADRPREGAGDGGSYAFVVGITALAPLSWSFYSALSKPASRDGHPVLWAYLTLVFGTLPLVAVAPFHGGPETPPSRRRGLGGAALPLPPLHRLRERGVDVAREAPPGVDGGAHDLPQPAAHDGVEGRCSPRLLPAVFAFRIVSLEWIGSGVVLLGLAVALLRPRPSAPSAALPGVPRRSPRRGLRGAARVRRRPLTSPDARRGRGEGRTSPRTSARSHEANRPRPPRRHRGRAGATRIHPAAGRRSPGRGSRSRPAGTRRRTGGRSAAPASSRRSRPPRSAPSRRPAGGGTGRRESRDGGGRRRPSRSRPNTRGPPIPDHLPLRRVSRPHEDVPGQVAVHRDHVALVGEAVLDRHQAPPSPPAPLDHPHESLRHREDRGALPEPRHVLAGVGPPGPERFPRHGEEQVALVPRDRPVEGRGERDVGGLRVAVEGGGEPRHHPRSLDAARAGGPDHGLPAPPDTVGPAPPAPRSRRPSPPSRTGRPPPPRPSGALPATRPRDAPGCWPPPPARAGPRRPGPHHPRPHGGVPDRESAWSARARIDQFSAARSGRRDVADVRLAVADQVLDRPLRPVGRREFPPQRLLLPRRARRGQLLDPRVDPGPVPGRRPLRRGEADGEVPAGGRGPGEAEEEDDGDEDAGRHAGISEGGRGIVPSRPPLPRGPAQGPERDRNQHKGQGSGSCGAARTGGADGQGRSAAPRSRARGSRPTGPPGSPARPGPAAGAGRREPGPPSPAVPPGRRGAGGGSGRGWRSPPPPAAPGGRRRSVPGGSPRSAGVGEEEHLGGGAEDRRRSRSPGRSPRRAPGAPRREEPAGEERAEGVVSPELVPHAHEEPAAGAHLRERRDDGVGRGGGGRRGVGRGVRPPDPTRRAASPPGGRPGRGRAGCRRGRGARSSRGTRSRSPSASWAARYTVTFA